MSRNRIVLGTCIGLGIFLVGGSARADHKAIRYAHLLEKQSMVVCSELRSHFQAAPEFTSLKKAAADLHRRAHEIHEHVDKRQEDKAEKLARIMERKLDDFEDQVDDVDDDYVTRKGRKHVEKSIKKLDDILDDLEDEL